MLRWRAARQNPGAITAAWPGEDCRGTAVVITTAAVGILSCSQPRRQGVQHGGERQPNGNGGGDGAGLGGRPGGPACADRGAVSPRGAPAAGVSLPARP